MNKSATALAALCVVLGCGFPDALVGQEKSRVRETISMRALPAIEAAVPEIKRITSDIAEYMITVSFEESDVIVRFRNPEDVSPGRNHVGCSGPSLCVVVRLRESDLKVLRVHGEK